MLYLSDYIESHRSDYYAALQRVRTHGDWRGWLLYFFVGVTVTARKGVTQARRLLEMREEMRRRLGDKPKAVALIDTLFVNPYITAARAEEILSVTAPTARQVLGYVRRVWRRAVRLLTVDERGEKTELAA